MFFGMNGRAWGGLDRHGRQRLRCRLWYILQGGQAGLYFIIWHHRVDLTGRGLDQRHDREMSGCGYRQGLCDAVQESVGLIHEYDGDDLGCSARRADAAWLEPSMDVQYCNAPDSCRLIKEMDMNKALLAILAVLALPAQAVEVVTLKKDSIKSGDVEVPIEIAIPGGDGPFPPVLFIHAKRGYDEAERRHITELAKMGFLVVAPDWQSGRMIERWPAEHDPDTEKDVEAGLDYLVKHQQACRVPVGVVGYSRGGYYSIRLADRRSKDIAAIATYAGHMQNPNASESDQLFRVAPEVMRITTPMLFLIGDQDFELRRMNSGRAFYALWERGVPVELQYYPMARRAFDFRDDQTPEEKIATSHARIRVREWLLRWMALENGQCK
jgi:carboxymethylenebutenolidase